MSSSRQFDDDDTAEMLVPESLIWRANSDDPPSAKVKVEIAALSHTGHVRDNNEDHYLVARLERSLKTVMTNVAEGALPASFDEVAHGMVVADGMGGSAAGEVASSMALLQLIELVAQTPDWMMKLNERETVAVVKERMTTRFRQIDEALRKQAAVDPTLTGMGTTLTVSVSLGAELIVGHLGDSRAYLLRDGKLYQLTRDNTLAQALIDSGIARPADAATRAMRHVLTAALGSVGEKKDPQVQRLRLNDGDQVLLCTDGLTEMVTDNTIAAVLSRQISANEACQTLIELALAAGGVDNVTVALSRFTFPAEEVPPILGSA